MNNDPGSQSMRHARRWSSFLPRFFSNTFVSIMAILASALIFFLALMGLLNLGGNKPSTGILFQIEVAAFLLMVVLSTIATVLLFINLMLVIAGNSAEQVERINIITGRNKMRKAILTAMEKAAEAQNPSISDSVIETFLPPPDAD
jgi:hypothetical protein